MNKLYAPCLVCGEMVEIDSKSHSSVICEDCKDAILTMRHLLDISYWNEDVKNAVDDTFKELSKKD